MVEGLGGLLSDDRKAVCTVSLTIYLQSYRFPCTRIPDHHGRQREASRDYRVVA